ncbi:MAG: hypothetical protein QM689_07945 [Oscillospiraceae bacterium]
MRTRTKGFVRKIISGTLAAVIAVSTMATTVFADDPYTTYSYDYWLDPIPSQSVYRVDSAVSGTEMGLSALSDKTSPLYISDTESDILDSPQDIYYEETLKNFWIVDSQNQRILRTDENLKIIGCYKTMMGAKSGTLELKKPGGVFVKVDSAGVPTMYIADTENSRVVVATVTGALTCSVTMELTIPDADIYTQKSKSFTPSKVLVDDVGTIYVVVSSINTGSVVFNKKGEFTGFYGANRVAVTADIIKERIWRIFKSDEQLSSMVRNVPTEYANFDIRDGFIYTVTEASNTATDAVKKLNAGGYNTWDNEVGNKYTFGDTFWAEEYVSGDTVVYSTQLTDIDVMDNGNINIIDFTSGRVFQYDKYANLIAIFSSNSSGNSAQLGTVDSITAVESKGSEVYVVDSSKDNITIFTETVFGKYVHKAFALYDEGKYTEAENDWAEVLKRDGTYTMAYVGLGKAYLGEEKYKDAMDNFKEAYDQLNYDKAFRYYREAWLRDNFNNILIGVLIFILVVMVVKKLRKRGYLHPIAFISRKIFK